ncbi:MAG: RNA polymerase sigma factor [Candidatus Acidiferrales bacterium]
MEALEILTRAKVEGWPDEYVVERVLAGETALYEIIVRRYNQRLYRIVRAILRDDAETEDVMQEAYVRVYQHLHQFEARSSFSTWLTRIAINEALARLRRRNRLQPLGDDIENGETGVIFLSESLNPEENASKAELGRMLESAMLALPERYRLVLVMRDVEGLSTRETADALDITEENVKMRLHRGRALMRKGIYERVGSAAKDALPFMGARCDRVVERVFQRLSSDASIHE